MLKFKYVGAEFATEHCFFGADDRPDGYEWVWKWKGEARQRFRLVYSNAAGKGYAGFAVCIKKGKKKA